MHIDALFPELANVNGVFEVARVLETFEIVRNAKDGVNPTLMWGAATYGF